MKKSILFVVVFIMSITTLTVEAQTDLRLHGEKTGLTIVSNNQSSLMVKVSISNMKLAPVATPQGLFNDLIIDGFSKLYNIGKPQLPTFNKLIELPYGGDYQVIVKGYSEEIIPLSAYGISNKIIPCQPSYSKNIPANEIQFQMDATTYSKDEFLANSIASIEQVGTMRGVKLANLVISPIQYNPVTNTLRILNNLQVEVKYNNPDAAATLNAYENHYSPAFDANFSSVILYPLNARKDVISKYPMKYVIVSDPMFQTQLQPFIQWKRKKGFTIIEAYTNNASVGTTTTSIKNYLQGLYTAGTTANPAPTYVLFVGDVAQIPAFTGTTGTHPSDLYYCTFDGASDNIPDMYYGRFSASATSQLQPQIDKTLMYEKYTMPSTGYLDTAYLVAGVDASWSPTHANGQINYASTYFNTTNGYSYVYSKLYPETDNSAFDPTMRAVIGAGVGYANYTAHCSESGWADPSYLTSNIAQMTNTNKYGLMIGNCCLSNKFDYPSGDCFGESLLKTANKGAVGYIGASNNSLWDEDFYWSVGVRSTVTATPTFSATALGAYDKLFHTQSITEANWFITNGQMTQGGNIAVQSSNSTNKVYYWEIYHLMGDPSVMTYLSIPTALTVTYSNPQNVGVTSLNVTTQAGAYVAISLNGVLLDAKLAGTNGIAALTFSAINTADTADIVVTKQNRQPFMGLLYILNPAIPYDLAPVTVLNPETTYSCSNISIQPKVTLRNMGLNALTSAIISYKIDNGSVVSQNWSGSIASMATADYTFPAIPLTVGNHVFKCWISSPNGQVDGNHANDTISKSYSVQNLVFDAQFTGDNLSGCNIPFNVNFLNSTQNALTYLWNFGDGTTSTEVSPVHQYTQSGSYSVKLIANAGACGTDSLIRTAYIQVGLSAPVASGTSICTPNSVVLNATGNGIIKWYTQSGGVSIFTGPSYTTPTLSTTTTYYVQSSIDNPLDTVGDTRSNASGAMFTSNTVHGVNLTCTRPVTLKSAVFNASSAGNRKIFLLNSAGDTINQVTVNIPSGVNRVALNLDIPAGNRLKLLVQGTCNLYRNNTGASYPYVMPGVISVDSSTAGTTGKLTYYYYFYNMYFQEAPCTSPIVPVSVVVGSTVVPSTITGTANVCSNQQDVVYQVPLVAGADSYVWTLPSGATGVSTTNSITVDFATAFTGGNITVAAHNSCGNSSPSTFSVTVIAAPANPGLISGNASICQGEQSVVYNVPVIANATSYEWILPSGAVGTSTSNTITVNYGVGATSGTIQVRGVNSCASGNYASLQVIVSALPAMPCSITGSLSVCQNSNSQYSITALDHVNSYIWTLPNGATGTSNTTSITVDFTNAQSGTISVIGVNDCGQGSPSTMNITVNAKPIAAFVPTIASTYVTFTNQSTNNPTSYFWSFGDGNSSNEVSPSHTYTQTGSYTATLIAFNDCGSDTTSQQIQITSIGIEEVQTASYVELYPNPSNDGNFNLVYYTQNRELALFTIYNTIGKVVYSESIEKSAGINTVNISLSDLSKGVYYLKTNLDNKVHKFIIK